MLHLPWSVRDTRSEWRRTKRIRGSIPRLRAQQMWFLRSLGYVADIARIGLPDPLRRNHARVLLHSRSVSRDRIILHGGGSESGIGGELRLARSSQGDPPSGSSMNGRARVSRVRRNERTNRPGSTQIPQTLRNLGGDAVAKRLDPPRPAGARSEIPVGEHLLPVSEAFFVFALGTGRDDLSSSLLRSPLGEGFYPPCW